MTPCKPPAVVTTPADAQLTLDLFNVTRHSFADYHAGPQQAVLAALEQWSHAAGPAVIYLWGAPASGKSHLLQAAVRAASERGARTMYLPLGELLAAGPAVLDGLDAIDAVALDDLDACAGDAAWEQRLFHLYNALVGVGGRLLWSGARAPAACPLGLRDLASRLAASLVFHLRELDDAAKAAVLAARAHERGLELAPAVLEFILRRERRDMGALVALLEELDAASLRQRRALTVPFVRAVLEQRAQEA
ncbi:MAG: DnaA regulatory inactivator Hda [Gammaproteobacteria bacterium]